MKYISITDYLEENQIEEKIPYFGKARLYTVAIPAHTSSYEFIIPRDIFHFITAIYLWIHSNTKSAFDIQLEINSDIQIKILQDQYTQLEQNIRHNLLKNPILYGQFVLPKFSIRRIRTETNEASVSDSSDMIHVLVEYGKIVPEDFKTLHEDSDICLLSSQGDQLELIQYRGNCIRKIS